MIGQLENARTQLANERKECNDKKRLVEEAERELLHTKEQLHNKEMENDRIKQNSSQLKVHMQRLSSRISVVHNLSLKWFSFAKDPDSLAALLSHIFFFQIRLKESQEIIAEKDAEIAEMSGIIELRENRLKIHNQEREQLVREHQVQPK